MIQNDLQRLRWMILDEALRDPVMEYFMGERTKTNETGNTRSLIHYVNTRLKAVNRDFSCSKRMLQNDLAYFVEKGAHLEPRFRRGHKRILRYINLQWKNPLLKAASFLRYDGEPIPSCPLPPTPCTCSLPEGPMTAITLRISKDEEAIRQKLGSPEILGRNTDAKTGVVTIQVELPMSEMLQNLILGMGTSVEVLAPESLREDLRQTINTLQKLYKKETSASKKPVQGDFFDGLF
ncbi:MAG: WYL domain-containing protein [Bacteroidaceae bacterium]|nr:WYL domain-containing protein [Bacteroidaceae bacterium]